MAMPAAIWTDEDVLAYDVRRWDHALLKSAGFDTSEYEQARIKLKHCGPKSKPESVAKAKEAFLLVKRALLIELKALRVASGQAMRNDPIIAGRAIAASSGAAEKTRLAMLKETARSYRKMQRLLGEQGNDLEDLTEVSKDRKSVV